MVAKRNSPLPGKTANSFLEAAQTQVARNGNREEDIAAEEKRKEKAAQAYVLKQEAFFSEHLVPILKQLVDLPERKGRSFSIETRFVLIPVEAPRLTVTIDYRGKPGPMLDVSDSLSLIMDDYIDADRFAMRIIRYDRKDPDNRHEHVTIPVIADVKLMKAEIGKIVADVAPDRVAELGASQKPSAKAPAPKP